MHQFFLIRSGNLPEEKRTRTTSFKMHLNCARFLKSSLWRHQSFHQEWQHKICFARTYKKSKNDFFPGVPVSKASANILEEWRKVTANNKKMKKYRDLLEEEKRRHEEALQRYQEDHMDEMEIINLHKRNKDRKTPQPQKAPKSPKFIETDDSSDDEQKPKKTSRWSDGKKPLQKQEKELKRPHCLKKHQSHLKLSKQITQARKKKKKLQGW